MNLRSKSTEIYLSASVSHYRGPFILVGADAPVGLPCATQLSYLRTALLLLSWKTMNRLAADAELLDDCAVTSDICLR
jgi:hypothetical protein